MIEKIFKSLTIVMGIVAIIVWTNVFLKIKKGNNLLREGRQQRQKSSCLIACLKFEKETNAEWFRTYNRQVLKDCSKKCGYK